MFPDVILLASLAGFAAFFGAGLGWFDSLKQDWLTCPSKNGIMAFGGGALLAAVALVLVPKGMEGTPLYLSASIFMAGAVFFAFLNACFLRWGTGSSQFMALMLDFVPEAIVLGAIITQFYNEAVFLAVLIAAQNLPEGFNAFREMTSGKKPTQKNKALLLMAAASVSGLLWASIGYFCFAPGDLTLNLLMMFCSGGIFYLVFHDIAPLSHEQRWLPSLGSVFGFMVGIIGHGAL